MMPENRPWCFNCPLKPKIIDSLSFCPEPEQKDRPYACPLNREEKDSKKASKIVTWVITGLFLIVTSIGGYFADQKSIETVKETGIQLVSQQTVVYPGYMTASQLKKLFTGYPEMQALAQDFVDAGEAYKIDPLILACIAAHESNYARNHFAVAHNNVMSYGVFTDPETREDYTYASKRENIMDTTRDLYLYYIQKRNLLTLWDIGTRYCPKTPLAWANDVNELLLAMEAKLPDVAQMKRWNNRTGIFDVPTEWNETRIITGFALWKVNRSTVIAGR